jgi:hypothetical protein
MNMDWGDYNWSMEEKGKEILVFFELFCGLVILADIVMCKIIDFLER